MAKKRMRFPMAVVLVLTASFLFGGASAFMLYDSGTAVAMTPRMAMISHTEYRFNEAGQIIARLVDFQGSPVVVNNCTATILYPDKTSFVSNALMTPSVISGDHYYNFTTPASGPEGVYEYQATCYYAAGAKNASVTNSFHLSSAFTSIFGNLSAINASIGAVQGNLTELSAQLNANISTVLSELQNVNSTLYNSIVSVNQSVIDLSAAVGGNFTNLDAALAGNFSVIQTNVTQILDAINGLNVTLGNLTVSVNLTPVLDAIASVNATVNQLSADMLANFTYTNSLITGVNASLMAEFSVVNGKLDVMNTTLNANNAYLVLINATTTDTYDYITGTLATNIGNILTDLGVINATVNRIETTTIDINTTVNAIKQNQEDAVSMSVFSG